MTEKAPGHLPDTLLRPGAGPEALLRPDQLGRADGALLVGAELATAQLDLEQRIARTGLDDSLRHDAQIISAAQDILSVVGSREDSSTLSSAVGAYQAELEAGGQFSHGTQEETVMAEGFRLATLLSGKVEGEYQAVYERETQAHPARSLQDNAGRARAEVMQRHGGPESHERVDDPEGQAVIDREIAGIESEYDRDSTEQPRTRREREGVLTAQERRRILRDPEQVDGVIDASRSDFRMRRLLPAERARKETPTPQNETTLNQRKSEYMGYVYLQSFSDRWKAAQRDGDTRDFGQYMTALKAEQDARMETYWASGDLVPAEVTQQTNQLNAAYEAFSGTESHSFESELNRRSLETARAQVRQG